MFLALAAGLGAALWQAARAEAEAVRAQAEADKAETVTTFLISLFEASNSEEARGDTLTAHELLERGAARVEALQDEPEVQTYLLAATGKAYAQLGAYDRARPLLQRALGAQQTLFGAASPEAGASLNDLASLSYNQGDFSTAESLFTAALAVRRQALGTSHEEVAHTLYNLASVPERPGRLRNRCRHLPRGDDLAAGRARP